MYQQVGHAENGVSLVLAYAHGDFLSVSLYYHSVERHRDRSPLVFLYPAVVMGLEERHILILVERVLL